MINHSINIKQNKNHYLEYNIIVLIFLIPYFKVKLNPQISKT